MSDVDDVLELLGLTEVAPWQRRMLEQLLEGAQPAVPYRSGLAAWRSARARSAGIIVGRERVGGDAGYRGAAEGRGAAVRQADRDPLA